MVADAIGRISRRADGKYFLYLPKHLVEDSGFPFKLESSVRVRVSLDLRAVKLLVTPLKRNQEARKKAQTWFQKCRRRTLDTGK